MTLRGRLVELREQSAADVPELNAICASPGVREWWGTDPRIDDQDAFTIWVGDAIAGWLGWYEETDADYRHGGLDVFVAPAFWGRRIGREALWLGARWLFSVRGHHRVVIDPATSNARAIAVYRSLGFRPVGVMRRYERAPDGSWRDGLLMDLLADELVAP